MEFTNRTDICKWQAHVKEEENADQSVLSRKMKGVIQVFPNQQKGIHEFFKNFNINLLESTYFSALTFFNLHK